MSRLEAECWETRKKHLKQFKKRAETLVNKAVELVSLCDVDLLIVIYSNELKQYIEYCNTDPSLLYFSLQNARETLGKVKKLHKKDTSFINKPGLISKLDFDSPPGIKRARTMTPTDFPKSSGELVQKECSLSDILSSQPHPDSCNTSLIKKSASQHPKRSQSTREPMSDTTETAETHRFFDWLVCGRKSGGQESE